MNSYIGQLNIFIEAFKLHKQSNIYKKYIGFKIYDYFQR